MKKLLKAAIAIALAINFANAQTGAPVSKAEVIATGVVSAMGGADNFAATHYIGWTFFGRRKLIWDKVHDRVRVDYITRPLTIITSLHNDSTLLFMDGMQITQKDSLAKYSVKGKKIWANDSYWLIMPFKLFDPGVNLAFVKDTIVNNAKQSILELTFNQVGFTPENKYWIFVDHSTHLVAQGSFFNNYTDPVPEFSDLWGDYQRYGKILISGDRGGDGKLENIHVWETLPENVFTDLNVLPAE